MKPPVDVIRLNQTCKDQMNRIKRLTGLKQWNEICRIAFLLSINDSSPVNERMVDGENAVEMSWRTFGGDNEDIFSALVRYSMQRSKCSDEAPEFLYQHLIRGLRMLELRLEKGGVSLLLESLAGR